MAYRAYILLQSSRIHPPGLHSELLNSWHCVIITNTEFFTHSVWWNIITKPWDAWARNCLSNSILEISLQTKKTLRIVLVVEVLPVAAAQIETRLCRLPKRPETNKPVEQVYDTLVPRQCKKGLKTNSQVKRFRSMTGGLLTCSPTARSRLSVESILSLTKCNPNNSFLNFWWPKM